VRTLTATVSAAGVLMSILLLIGCSANQGGTTGDFLLADQIFAFLFGQEGEFEVRVDEGPVAKESEVTIFEEEPTDEVETGIVTLKPENLKVVAIDFAGRTRTATQVPSGTIQINVRVDSNSSTTPCTTGVEVGTFVATFEGEQVSMEQTELDLPSAALTHVATGVFSLCLEVSASINIDVTIEEMGWKFGPAVEPEAQEEQLLYTNTNVGTVFSGPLEPTMFTLDASYRITNIRTYHWTDGMGTAPGTIALEDAAGNSYGPWSAVSASGNLYWDVNPDVILEPGVYTIIDSDNASWSHNDESGAAGIAWVYGVLVN